MRVYIMLYQIITMANANIMHSVEQWFRPDVEELAEHLTGMVQYYQMREELTDYQFKTLSRMIHSMIELSENK